MSLPAERIASADASDISVAPGLRGGSLGFVETIGQSIANVAPTLTPALNITVVASIAGAGSWLAYLIASIGMMFVAGNIGVLARRHPMAGAYFIYIGRTLGNLAGHVAGWSMIAAYAGCMLACVFGGRVFVADLLKGMGLAALMPPGWLFDLAFVGLVWLFAHRDIRLSSRVSLVLEALSLVIIGIITVMIVARRGHIIDPMQLDLPSLGFAGVTSALAFAVFSFVGFESAATLAKESRNPTQTIPRVLMLSAGIAGVFFVVMAYAMVLGVHDKTKVISRSASPFVEVAGRAGMAAVAEIVYAAALISAFACALASLNAVSRLMFSMGRYGFLHRAMGVINERHGTPHIAIAAAALSIALVCLGLAGFAPIDAFGYTGTFATFGFLAVYLLISIVAPLDLSRAGIMRMRHLAVGVIGVALMLFVFFGSLYPMPDYPYNLLPYLFAAYLAVGAAWFYIASMRAPQNADALLRDLE
jgi:amino acid transporter